VALVHRDLGLMPEALLLIIFSAVFAPSVALLLTQSLRCGWFRCQTIRAEFLRNSQLDYMCVPRGRWG
jgi:microcin C transport system permease protein